VRFSLAHGRPRLGQRDLPFVRIVRQGSSFPLDPELFMARLLE
jgi:hypothetical protein